MASFLVATASGLVVAGLGAIVALLVKLVGLTATQNGSLVRLIQEFDAHRAQDHADFTRVHERLDHLTRDPLLG